MSLIDLGFTASDIDATDTTPKGGFQPFPCAAGTWTRHTAQVTKAAIKVFPDGGEAIAITLANGDHGGELLVSLQPDRLGPNVAAKDQEKTIQQNKDTLRLAIKILNAHTDGKLDTAKLERAKGPLVTIIAKHNGFRTGNDGRQYHKVGLILKGSAETLEPVKAMAMPPIPGQTRASAPADVATDYPWED